MAANPVARRRVLIVDDEPIITDTLTAIFSKAGYEVQGAYSAERAIEIISTWLPDLALLDVILPGMNGIQLATVLATNYPTCRILLLSGQSRTADLLAEASQDGHNFEILAKPVYPTVLLDKCAALFPSSPSDEPEIPGASA